MNTRILRVFVGTLSSSLVTRRSLLIASACTLSVFAFVYVRPHQQVSYSTAGIEITGRRCPFLSTLSSTLQCGWLTTADATSERVALAVIRLRGSDGAGTGTLVLDGGPGQPSLMGAATYRYWSDWGTRLGVVGDLILFDYRGTGESEPLLGCESRSLTPAAGWDEEPSDPGETSGWVDELRECATAAVQAGQTLENLSTERNANDAVAILRALQYEDWNLYAVSYGAVVAQRILDTHPEQLSRAILDSPPPLARAAELTVLGWDSVPDLLDELCPYLGECREGTSSDLRRALTRLRQAPHRFHSKAIVARLIVDDFRFLQTVVDALSDRNTRRELPWIVGAAAEGDYGGLETLVEVFLEAQSASSSNDLVYWATECRDFGQIDSAAFEDLLRAHPFAQTYIPGLGCPLDLHAASRVSAMGGSSHQTEALVLSARFDPISPFAVGRDVAAKLEARHVVFDEASHGVAFDDDSCVAAVASEFFRTGRVTESSSCARQP